MSAFYLFRLPLSSRWNYLVLVFLMAFLHIAEGTANSQQPSSEIEKTMIEMLDAGSGRTKQFRTRVVLQVPFGEAPQDVMVDVFRDEDKFDLSLVHEQYAIEIRQRPEGTALALPRFKVVFLGEGKPATYDHLGFEGLALRLISGNSEPGQFASLLLNPAMAGAAVMNLAKSAAGAKVEDSGKSLAFGGVKVRLTQPNQIAAAANGMKIRAGLAPLDKELPALRDWPGYRVEEVDRNELEKTIVRGIRRATEIMAPNKYLQSPSYQPRQVANGRLEVVDGHLVAILRGTPEQIGKAHGELLKYQTEMCIDSVLYTFGLAQTVSTGKWFRKELDSAFARLEPHIPQRFRDENRALALAINESPELVDAVNVFPELFHCSGFALFGSATADGKLYHGRVLDYMTEIGLQHAATTFVIAPDGQTPFVNVGYAGFTGSVTGMNAKKISLGEMGGSGEGKWDGVPMATLMRIALEQCSTLDEVIELWKDSPRTCEYYYVFADGNSNSAVGVAATPESIEFVRPGESHAKLGEGIQDAIVLSEGERLETLRNRVLEKKGTIDSESAIALMSRPVAMTSNLHNVLFVPADGILYVANAGHKKPAAEMPYVMLDLNELLALPRGEAEEEWDE